MLTVLAVFITYHSSPFPLQLIAPWMQRKEELHCQKENQVYLQLFPFHFSGSKQTLFNSLSPETLRNYYPGAKHSPCQLSDILEHSNHCLLVRKTGDYYPYFTDGEPYAGQMTCPVTQLTSSKAWISYHSSDGFQPECLPLYQAFSVISPPQNHQRNQKQKRKTWKLKRENCTAKLTNSKYNIKSNESMKIKLFEAKQN